MWVDGDRREGLRGPRGWARAASGEEGTAQGPQAETGAPFSGGRVTAAECFRFRSYTHPPNEPESRGRPGGGTGREGMPGAPSSRFPPESPHWVSLGREALVGLVAEPAQGSRQHPGGWNERGAWPERVGCGCPRVSRLRGVRCQEPAAARPVPLSLRSVERRGRGRGGGAGPGLRVRAGGLPPGGRPGRPAGRGAGSGGRGARGGAGQPRCPRPPGRQQRSGGAPESAVRRAPARLRHCPPRGPAFRHRG